MSDQIKTKQTSLQSDEVIVRAVQFFATEKFRVSSQSARAATFDGRVPIPWFMLLLTILGYLCCLVPGIIMYILVIRKMRRFQNLVVTATPADGGTHISITYPENTQALVDRFLKSLP